MNAIRKSLASLLVIVSVPLSATAEDKIDFVTEIKPILTTHCLTCHGPDEQEGEYRLDRKADALRGGARGTAIVPGKSKTSSLIQFVSGKHEDGRMPPEGEGKALTKQQVAKLREWVNQGAIWPESHATITGQIAASDHWSFKSPIRPMAPTVKNQAWVRNPIDAFILSQLESESIAPSAETKPETLIRRLHLDLTGIPPTAEEIKIFVNDSSDAAYQKLIDKLLASKHFGERWGRHWLDLARYADSNGYEKDDYRPTAWRFRDWVINAINADLPFDQFTIEQLAGDLLPDATPGQLIATGFHRQTLINTEGGVDQEEFRNKAVVDRVVTTGTTWLGLTVGCAECHSHKYDPISQSEFYQLFAFFNNADAADYNFPTTGSDAKKFAAELKTHSAAELKLVQQIEEARSANADPAGRLNKLINSWMRLRLKSPKSPAGWAMVFQERESPRKTHVHVRGDFLNPGEAVQPGTLVALQAFETKSNLPNRLDLAHWIVDSYNPLTARVAVNRIWQHLFGRGIVASVDDFGSKGAMPSHPQLLDWLATEYVRLKWSRKALLKTIVTSSAYRQSSANRTDVEQLDPENTLISRQGRFRVDAEIVRDLYLSAGGLLNSKVGGPSIRPQLPPSVAEVSYASNIKWRVSKGDEKYRRGLYIVFQRTVPYPSLMAFDCPDGVVTSPLRTRSNTPLQSLTLMNDPVFFECTQAMGQRLLNLDEPKDDRQRLKRAGLITLGRDLTSFEIDRLHSLLKSQEKDFLSDAKSAKQYVGNFVAEIDKKQSDRPPYRTAAWISVCSVLMNLDEFLTRE